MAWCVYPIILVLGMGKFQDAVSFLAWIEVEAELCHFESLKEQDPVDLMTE